MRAAAMAALAALTLATAAPAGAPETSPFPVWRAPGAAPADLPREVPDPSERTAMPATPAPVPGPFVEVSKLAPQLSQPPQHRPEGDGVGGGVEVTALSVAPLDLALLTPGSNVPRPKWRPKQFAKPEAHGELVAYGLPVAPPEVAASGLAVARSLLPRHRPLDFGARIEKASAIRIAPAPVPIGKDGLVCGLPGVKGTPLSPVVSSVKGCGIAQPVKITSVDGLRLSTPATIDCVTAAALSKWVRGAVIPAFGKRGGGVAQLQVAASYSCRPRNNQKGAKLSEHGMGHAIDISGFVLKNGVEISVLSGWHDAAQGKILKALHKSACGTFGTVLGPTSDSFHQNHLHLDTARYRGGAYCR